MFDQQVLTFYTDRGKLNRQHSPPMASPSPPLSSSPSNDSAPSDGSTEFDPAELLSDLSELPFADEPHSDTASSEYDPDLDLFSPYAPHTLLVEVTRHRTVDNPEELREQMEAEVRSIGEGVVGICWTTVVADRLIGSYFEESVGLPVPGEKLLENRALAAAHSDKQGSADEEGPDQASTSEPTSASTKAESSASEASAPIDDQRSVTFTFELKGLSIVVGYLLGRKLAEWGRDELVMASTTGATLPVWSTRTMMKIQTRRARPEGFACSKSVSECRSCHRLRHGSCGMVQSWKLSSNQY